MLSQIKINNFKSWKNLDLNLKSITGLFGTNSSGKSSLLQFLLMLKQTKETSDRSISLDFGNPKSYTNLGSFHDAILNHNENAELSWEINWTLLSELGIVDTTSSRKNIIFSGKEMSVETSIAQRNKQLINKYLKYTFSNQKFTLTPKENRPSSFELSTSGQNATFNFVRNKGRVWDIPGPIKSYAFPDQAKTYHQNADLLSDLEFSYEKLMDQIFYLGPLRDYPKREYTWSGSSPIDVGQKGEKVVDAIIAARARGEERSLGYKKRKRPFEAIIAYWLKELKLIHDFKVIEIAPHSNLYKIELIKDAGSIPVLITDVGFGISQFLPVLVLLYYVPEGSIVLLEQPEIHLHPSVQSGLADVIVNAMQTRNIQVIVESHSEHLLRRIQLRIAEEAVSSEQVEIYFCETYQGISQHTKLQLDLYGSISNWPNNFFGDEYGEIAAIQKAQLERKISEQS